MILELAQKARRRRAVAGALVEHAADMCGERHLIDQRLGEDLLAGQHVGLGVGSSHRRQLDIAAADMGKAQQLQ